MTTASRNGVRNRADIAAVEADYRAGLLSIRAIGTKYGVSEGAIRKWAKKALDSQGNPAPWRRDLKPQVKAQVAEMLAEDAGKGVANVPAVRTTHARAREEVRPQEDVLAEAAASAVDVVRQHRRSIHSARQVVKLLMTQLQEAISKTGVKEIEQEATGDRDGERQAFLMRAVNLPQHAQTVRDLATALQKLTFMERQAFGLSVDADPMPPPPKPAGKQPEDADFTRIREKFAQRLVRRTP
jgi:transposase